MRTEKEINDEYNILCALLGDAYKKKRALGNDISKLYNKIDELSLEMDQVLDSKKKEENKHE